MQGEKLELPVSTGTHYLVKTSADGGNWIEKRCRKSRLDGKESRTTRAVSASRHLISIQTTANRHGAIEHLSLT